MDQKWPSIKLCTSLILSLHLLLTFVGLALPIYTDEIMDKHGTSRIQLDESALLDL